MLTRDLSRRSLSNPFRSWWDPLGQFGRFSEVFDRALDNGAWSVATEYPALNLWDNKEEVVVTAELPGFNPDDVEVSVVQNTLTLRGSRTPEELKQGETYHRRERWNGKFVRTLELPFEVDHDKVEAQFRNGVLSIRLPRAPQNLPKKITVKAS
jgi:HSP20 family protein